MTLATIGFVPVVIFLVVVGFVLWLVGDRINATLRNIIIFLICLALALWLLDAFGIYPLPAAFHFK
jgi:cytosine/uracil/thiamine/allantoin permease